LGMKGTYISTEWPTSSEHKIFALMNLGNSLHEFGNS